MLTARHRVAFWISFLCLVRFSCYSKAEEAPGNVTTGVTSVPSMEGFISIDCGRLDNASMPYKDGVVWAPDSGFTSGVAGTLDSSAGVFPNTIESTYRYFPVGTKNCYTLRPVTPGDRYMIRIRAHYFNYDGLFRTPVFNISVGASWTDAFYPESWPYGEYIVNSSDHFFDVCFIRVDGGGDPFVTSLEVRPIGQIYREPALRGSILTTWWRLDCGLNSLGMAFENSIKFPYDTLDRLWGSDRDRYMEVNKDNETTGPLVTWPADVVRNPINSSLDSVPPIVYSTASTPPGNETVLSYSLRYDNVTCLPFMLYLYFAEIDPTVKPGDRVFDILVNSQVRFPRLDIRAQGGVLGVFNVPLFLSFDSLMNRTGGQRWPGEFNITLAPTPESKIQKPIISGIESYILEPIWKPTEASNVAAMRNLRNQLRSVNDHPIINTWGGDPCRPVPWDLVTCFKNAKNTVVVAGLNLGGLGLNGTIPAAIEDLGQLRHLLLNDNNFVGTLPPSLPSKLQTIRVDNNRLTGNLPATLALLPSLSLLNVSYNPLSGALNNTVLINLADKLRGQLSVAGTELCPSPIPQCNGTHNPVPPRNNKKEPINIVAVIGAVPPSAVFLGALCAIAMVYYLQRNNNKKPTAMFSNIITSSIGSDSTNETDGTSKKGKDVPVAAPGSASFGRGGRIYTLQDMARATQNWSHSNIIGVGGFGVVYRGSLGDGKELAIKKRSGKSVQGEREFYNEVDLLSRLRHKHLVLLLGYCHERHNQILVYEFMPMGTVRDQLYDDRGDPLGKLNWRVRLGIALGAARGIEYLHYGSEPSIIHRDIKSSNILLDDKYMAKVADFGLSTIGPQGSKTHVSTAVKGTAGYMDPEYYSGQPLTLKSDVFSFGVFLLELMVGRDPINHNRERRQRSIVEWAREEMKRGNLEGLIDPTLGSSWSSGPMWKLAEITVKCVEKHGEDRPTMAQVVQELKDAVDMEFGMQSYLSGPSSSNGTLPPHYLIDMTADSSVKLDVEAR